MGWDEMDGIYGHAATRAPLFSTYIPTYLVSAWRNSGPFFLGYTFSPTLSLFFISPFLGCFSWRGMTGKRPHLRRIFASVCYYDIFFFFYYRIRRGFFCVSW